MMLRRIFWILLSFTLVGCGAGRGALDADAADGCARRWASEVTASSVPAGGWLVVDPHTGCVVDEAALAARLAGADIVYVGERHDVVAHHRFQAAVVEQMAALARQDGAEVRVGFEMFRPAQQPVLDQYSRGELESLEVFLEAVDWAGSWGMDAALYEPVLALGPRPGVRFVGLNAERALSRRVYEVGLGGLTPEERAALPAEIDASDEAYRAFVLEALAAHVHGELPAEDDPEWLATQQRFFEAQLVWDEAMADNLVRTLASAEPGARAVVIAGAGHVRNRWGIPQRVQRRLASVDGSPWRDLVIVCEVAEEAPRALDPTRADLYCLSR